MKIVTHNSKFHADDVFAVAVLSMIFPDSEIIRTRDETVIESADIVVDVGKIYDPAKLRFDHHQTGGAGVRDNGIPYASFGLVWKEYGESLAEAVAAMVEEKLVMPIDALDNGVTLATPKFGDIKEYGISEYLYSYWIDSNVSEEKILEIFISVVNLAKELISREIEKNKRIINDGKLVEEIYAATEDKRIIILDKNYAWGRKLVEKPEPLIVIYPSLDVPKWNIQTIRKNLTSFESRISLPASWAGKSGEELVSITGVKDAHFCHNGRFLAVAGSKEGALKLAEIALNS
jgi:uncharacterized UPF0160 family protein